MGDFPVMPVVHSNTVFTDVFLGFIPKLIKLGPQLLDFYLLKINNHIWIFHFYADNLQYTFINDNLLSAMRLNSLQLRFR